MKLLGSILLLVSGLVHLIPAVYEWLTDLTGGTEWIQMVIGAASVIVAVSLFVAGDKSEPQASPPTGETPGA